jgi:predicted nucleic acid-binding protein
MKVFFDTNVVLDLLDEARPNHLSSAAILSVARRGLLKVCVSTQSIIDASYVQTQSSGVAVEQFRSAIRLLTSTAIITYIEKMDIDLATSCQIPDYEDAAQIACALDSSCDAIISNDSRIARHTSLPVYTPKAFYEKILGLAD